MRSRNGNRLVILLVGGDKKHAVERHLRADQFVVSTRRAWQRIWDERPWLAGLFLDGDRWRATARWSGLGVAGVADDGYVARYRKVTRHAGPRCVVFWSVGRYVEFHGPQRLLAERTLDLRRVPLARGDYALTAGFPHWLSARFALRALRAGLCVARVPSRSQPRASRAGERLVVLSPVVSCQKAASQLPPG